MTGDRVARRRRGVRWVWMYSSEQSILLVGDGDFSFALALAAGFGSAANIVAPSLDSYEVLKSKYSREESNLAKLKQMGATILHGKKRFHTDLKIESSTASFSISPMPASKEEGIMCM